MVLGEKCHPTSEIGFGKSWAARGKKHQRVQNRAPRYLAPVDAIEQRARAQVVLGEDERFLGFTADAGRPITDDLRETIHAPMFVEVRDDFWVFLLRACCRCTPDKVRAVVNTTVPKNPLIPAEGNGTEAAHAGTRLERPQ